MDTISATVDTNELIRVIGAALRALGLDRSVTVLESECNIQVNSQPARQLRAFILDGNWPESLRVLGEIAMGSNAEVKSARYAILEQQYLELLQAGNDHDAVVALKAIGALDIKHEEVEILCYLLLLPSSVHVPARANLLPQLEKLLPPGVFVEKRLVELVEQALVSQTGSCIYHNSAPQTISLFRDHRCGTDQLPSRILQTARAHNGAISRLEFSKRGDFLASCDQNDAIIWRVYRGRLILTHLLSGPDDGFIAHSCWDPEGLQLLTCGESGARRWDIISGECLATITKNDVSMLSCAWTNDENGRSVIFTGNDDDSISAWTEEGNESRNWPDKTIRKSDFAVSANMEIVFASDTNTVSLFNSETLEEKRVEENSILVSLAFSSDLKNLLISLSNNTISLWNIEGRPKQIRFFDAADIVDFNNGVCFGGVDDAFVVGANRDSMVRIWHKCSGDLVCTLEGHEGAVESVCWNPTLPTMLVSGGDDGVILVWGTDAGDAKTATN